MRDMEETKADEIDGEIDRNATTSMQTPHQSTAKDPI
jgi:hypothetical protein